uniref:SEC7 domain-containing protein n=1 Tax=Trichuris muris TaxID=70415 RepID=A0A5S6QUR4_TRIMR
MEAEDGEVQKLDKSEEPDSAQERSIVIKVVNQHGQDVSFRVKSQTSMEKVKRTYALRMQLPLDSLRFQHDGRRITDDMTPESLKLQNNEAIEVYQGKSISLRLPSTRLPGASYHLALPIMGTSALYVVHSELNAVVTQLRRNQRVQTGISNSQDPFLRSFIDLRDVLNSVSDLTDVAPSVFVSPFLDVIRSEQTCGAATGQALVAVEKFVSYGMFDPHCFTASSAVQQIAEAVTHARFVGTDPSDDEVVLLRILQVLRVLLLSSSGPLLTDETVCEILQSCFRICFEERLSLLLRKAAESCLRDMVMVIFTRLSSFVEDPRHPYVKRLIARGAAREERKHRKRKKWNYGQQQTSCLTTAGQIGSEKEMSVDSEMNVELTSKNDSTGNADHQPGDAVMDVHSGTEASAENVLEVAKRPSGDQVTVADSVNVDVNLGRTNAEQLPSPSSDKSYPEDVSKMLDSPCSNAPYSAPHGIPCARELMRFLIALCNPWGQQNSDGIIELGLSLLLVAFEVGIEEIGRFTLLLPLVQNDLCRNLNSLLLTTKASLLSLTLRLGFLLFESLRVHLKLQLEMYLLRLMELAALTDVLPSPNNSAPSIRALAVSSNVRMELRELVLEALVALWRVPGFVTELYLNYDCDLYCSSLFEELTKLLSKNAFPVTGLTGAHVLSLDALLTVIDTIEMNCHMRMISFKEKPICSDERRSTGNVSSKLHHCYATSNSGITDSMVYAGSSELETVKAAGQKETMLQVPSLRRSRVLPSASIPSHEDLIALKTKKRILTAGSELFNQQPLKGITYLQEHGLLETPYNLGALVQWLRENPRLNKRKIAEFIVNRKNKSILEAFVRSFDFRSVRLDDALRLFLESFRLPGEAAEISMIIEYFADHWYNSNEKPFASTDAAFTLAYAVIMLNVDQHNPTAKKQQQPMSLEEFVKNLNGVNGGKNFDPSMLEKIYVSIRNEEIVMPEEQSGIVRENYLWEVLLRRGSTDQGRFLHAPSGLYDHDLFSLVWGPTIAALSFVFDKTSEQDAVVARIISGFRKSAAIAAHYSMCDVFDNLIISLCKFSTLMSIGMGAESNDHFCASFAASSKAQMAAKTMFHLVHSHGDILREGWKNILECLLHCYHAQLLPRAMLQVEDFVDARGFVSIARRPTRPAKTDSSIFTSLYNYLGGGGSNDSRTSSNEAADCVCTTRAVLAECHPEQIISDSKYLSGEAFSELLKALLMASALVLTDIRQGTVLSEQAEFSLIFYTELTIAVALENRDRIGPFWRTLTTHLFSLMSDFGEKRFLTERATVGLMRLAVRLLVRDEVRDDVLSSLRLLQSMKPASLLVMARQIAFGLHAILRNNAAHIKRQAHWSVLFSLLETVGAAAFPSDWERCRDSSDEGIQSDEDRASMEVGRDDRGYTSDSEVYNVGKRTSLDEATNAARLGQRASSGEWLFVVKKDAPFPVASMDATQQQRFSSNRLLLRSRLRSHDPQAYVKCCETLTFLVRDMAHITQENFDACVQCLRTFIEAGLNGGFHYMDQSLDVLPAQNDNSRSSKSRGSKKNRGSADSNDKSERDSSSEAAEVGAVYLQLSLQLLDLTYLLFVQAAAVFGEESGDVPFKADIWGRVWQPLLQAMARLCFDRRKVVRSTAVTLLQRSLLIPELRRLDGADWEKCFYNVFFPLLNALVENAESEDDTCGNDETRVRALTMAGKVFLQHLMFLSALPSFVDLWMDILSFMERYLQLKSSDLSESVPESVKNMLLVMDTADLFHRVPTLLERTEQRLTGPFEALADTIGKRPSEEAGISSEESPPKASELDSTLEEVIVIDALPSQEIAKPAVNLVAYPNKDNVTTVEQQQQQPCSSSPAAVVLFGPRREHNAPVGNLVLLPPSQPSSVVQPLLFGPAVLTNTDVPTFDAK